MPSFSSKALTLPVSPILGGKVQFMSYALEYGEGILHQAEGVRVTGGLDLRSVKMLITSKYIVFIEPARRYGQDDEEVAKLPITDVRVYQNVPQVIITGDSLEPHMDIYFDSMSIKLDFGNIIRPSKKKAAFQQCIAAITTALVGNPSSTTVPSSVPQENKQSSNPNAPIMHTANSAGSSVTSTIPASSVPTSVPFSNAPQRNFCGNCGQKIDSTSNFCKYCGTKL